MDPTSLVPRLVRGSVDNSPRSATITTCSVQQLRPREYGPSSTSFVRERGMGYVPCSVHGM